MSTPVSTPIPAGQCLRIAFAGTPHFAVPALNALAASQHTVVGVLTQPDRPAGRGRALTASAIKQRALELDLPLAQPQRLASEPERAALATWRPDLLVVVAYGLILPLQVLQLPRLGCLNIHASLLPRWRGAAPIQRAILAGDVATGVAIMALEPALDTGPVYALERVAIAAHETAGELQLRLSLLGATALLAVVAALAAGTAVAQPQPSEGVSYAAKLRKEEALIDWHGTARQIELAVRAFNPWPVAETTLAGARVRIWRAHAVPVTATTQLPPGTLLELRGGALHVACGSGELAITELQLPGKRAISAAEFARAHPLAGLRFGAGGG